MVVVFFPDEAAFFELLKDYVSLKIACNLFISFQQQLLIKECDFSLSSVWASGVSESWRLWFYSDLLTCIEVIFYNMESEW